MTYDPNVIVSRPASKEYEETWDRVFGKEKEKDGKLPLFPDTDK